MFTGPGVNRQRSHLKGALVSEAHTLPDGPPNYTDWELEWPPHIKCDHASLKKNCFRYKAPSIYRDVLGPSGDTA